MSDYNPKTPWQVSGTGRLADVRDTDGVIVVVPVAGVTVAHRKACDHIVRCVNAHDDMLEALENLTIAIGMGWDLDGVLAVADAAIKKARGEK